MDARNRVTVWIGAIDEDDLFTAADEAVRAVAADLGDMSVLDAGPVDDMDPATQVLAMYVCETDQARLTVRARRGELGSVVMVIMGREEDVASVADDLDQMWKVLQVPAEERVLL